MGAQSADLHAGLTAYCILVLGAGFVGLGSQGLRLLGVGERKVRAARTLIDRAEPKTWRAAAWEFLTGPARAYHVRSSRLWTCGYACYHAAIFMVVTGYAFSLARLVQAFFFGTIPEFDTGLPGPQSHSIANGLAFVFGNAEQFPSTFLFGRFAPWFRGLTACELPLAVTGNACLLYAALRKDTGAIRRDLDPAAGGLRLDGIFSGQHLLVRLIILAIIAMEFAGRFAWLPGVAYAHAFLGLTLIGLVPFTYLRHIPLAPLAVWQAVRRRRWRTIA